MSMLGTCRLVQLEVNGKYIKRETRMSKFIEKSFLDAARHFEALESYKKVIEEYEASLDRK